MARKPAARRTALVALRQASAPGGRRAGSRRLPGAERGRVTGEARYVLRLRAVVVAADAERAIDEHEAVAVRDGQGGRVVVGPGDLEAVAQQSGQRVARPGHEEPAVARAGAAGVVEQHLERVVRRVDAEKLNEQEKHDLVTFMRQL